MTPAMLFWLTMFCLGPSVALGLSAAAGATEPARLVAFLVAGGFTAHCLIDVSVSRYAGDSRAERGIIQLGISLFAASALVATHAPFLIGGLLEAPWGACAPVAVAGWATVAISADRAIRSKARPRAAPPARDAGAEWFDWFAWYPVRLDWTRRIVWLRPVQYRRLDSGLAHRALLTGDGLWS